MRTVVQMERDVMLMMPSRDGACFAVLASADSDVSQVAYEMTVIVRQVGELPDAGTSRRAAQGVTL